MAVIVSIINSTYLNLHIFILFVAMLIEYSRIICFVAYILHCSSGQDIEPKELGDILKDIENSNSSEARTSLTQKLCALGYCDTKTSDDPAEKTNLNRVNRQFQITNSPDYSEIYGSNIDYSEFIGDKVPEQKQQLIQDTNTPPPSTHIHHHFHHNTNNNEDYQKEQIDFQGIRNAKNYAFQQQKLPIGVKKFSNNYYERPQMIANPNLNYPAQINKSPFTSFNTKKTQYIADNNIQQLQSLNDCSCVPYQYCATEDVVGRRDDLVLPLDPRNLNKDIEAEQNLTKIEDETKHVSKRDVDKSVLTDVEPVCVIVFKLSYILCSYKTSNY